MENFKFEEGNTVRFKDKEGNVIIGEVIKVHPYDAYTIAYNGKETIFLQNVVEAGQLFEQHSVSGGKKEKIFTYYIMPSKRRQNNKNNSKKNRRGGGLPKSNEEESKTVEDSVDEESRPINESNTESNEESVDEESVDKKSETDETESEDTLKSKVADLEKRVEKLEKKAMSDEEVKGPMTIEELDESEGGRRRTHKKNRNNRKSKKNRKSQRRR